MITNKLAVRGPERLKLRLKRCYLRAKLMKFRFLRLGLELQIRCAALKCLVLCRDEPKSLLENRRRAVLVDEFFKKLDHLSKAPNKNSSTPLSHNTEG